MGNKEKNITKNAKVNTETVNTETVNTEIVKTTGFDMLDRLLAKVAPDTKIVAGKETDVITIKYEVKKDGETKLVTRTIDNPKLVTTLTNIDKLSVMNNVSLSLIVLSMGMVDNELAKKYGFKSSTDLLKKKYAKTWSDNTIVKYYNIARVFGDFSGESPKFRSELDDDISISNLDVVLTLCKDYDKAKTPEEFTEVFNTFWNTYVSTGLVHLYTTQKKLKEEVDKAKKGVIEGVAKDVTKKSGNNGDNENGSNNSNNSGDADSNSDNSNNNGDNENDSDNSTNSGDTDEKSENKWETATNCLTIIATCFKGSEDEEVLHALSVIAEKISKMLNND